MTSRNEKENKTRLISEITNLYVRHVLPFGNVVADEWATGEETVDGVLRNRRNKRIICFLSNY